MVAGRVLAPGAVEAPTVTANENVLSPAVASPFEPSSKNVWPATPPMRLKSAETVIPVLDGPEPGVTITVNNTLPPWITEPGFAAPVPERLVVVPVLFRGFGAPVAKS